MKCSPESRMQAKCCALDNESCSNPKKPTRFSHGVHAVV